MTFCLRRFCEYRLWVLTKHILIFQPYKDKYSREYLEFKNLKAVWWNNLTASQKEEYLSSKEETKKTKARKNYKKVIA